MWRWLKSTDELQRETYGYGREYEKLLDDPSKIAKYIDWNQTAAVQELAELREEFSWKPWATDQPFYHRGRIIEEAVDVLHFIGNILTAMKVDDDEFWDAYRKKQQKNRERAASGTYSARKGGLAEGSDA